MLYCNTLRLKIGRKRGVRNNEITLTPPWKNPSSASGKGRGLSLLSHFDPAPAPVVIPSKVETGREDEDNGGGSPKITYLGEAGRLVRVALG